MYLIQLRNNSVLHCDNSATIKYLNGEFYDKFSITDKSRIIPVINKNPDNQWYGSKGGADTQGSIFLLTIEDVVCRCFGDSSEKLYNPGKNKNIGLKEKIAITVSK